MKLDAQHIDFRPGEVRHIALDVSRAERELGWKPRTSLEQGMEIAVEYYRPAAGC